MAVRVLHLVGSPQSRQFDDLSRLYARDCLTAVEDPARYDPVIAHVDPGGAWRFPSCLTDQALDAAPPLELAAAVRVLAELEIDVMVPHMFCLTGMTHHRALFDLMGIPYVGNAPEVMAAGARKDLARAIVSGAGVRVPAGQLVADPREVTLALPLIVKPVDADNSSGVTLVTRRAGLAAAVQVAAQHGSAVLVEQFIAPGREVRCAVLDDGQQLACLPLEEYPVELDRPIREAGDKLGRDDRGKLRLMAKGGARAWMVDRDDPIVTSVWSAARSAHRAMGCRDYSLFDFRIDPDGRPWFLEAGLYCSFAPQSVVATMADAAGIALTELFATMLGQALARGTRPTVSRA